MTLTGEQLDDGEGERGRERRASEKSWLVRGIGGVVLLSSEGRLVICARVVL